MLRLYTKDDCPYCDVMKEKLKEWGVPYSTINVSINPIGLQYLKDAGLRTVPQLMIEDTSLNDGVDTRKFTIDELRVRMIHWGKMGTLSPELKAWVSNTVKVQNESKSV